MSRLIGIYTVRSCFDFQLTTQLSVLDMSKFKDRRVHFRNSGMTELRFWRKVWRKLKYKGLSPVVQSVVSLTSSLRVISLTVSADSIYNILILFAEKMWVAFAHYFFSKKFQHICVSLDVNFNELLTNDIVSFEHLSPDELYHSLKVLKESAEALSPLFWPSVWCAWSTNQTDPLPKYFYTILSFLNS